MARIFPLDITSADVATMLTTIESKAPYIYTRDYNKEVLACFDCEALELTLCVALLKAS